MAKNVKPTELGITEGMTPEQKMAAMEQKMMAEIAEMKKAAEEKMAKAEAMLESAKLAAASIPTAPAAKKAFSQEVNEMAKLTMIERMTRQFGDRNQVKWVTNVIIPIDPNGVEMNLDVTINGIEYNFARAEVYDMPEELWNVILRSRYVESPLAKKARNGELITRV